MPNSTVHTIWSTSRASSAIHWNLSRAQGPTKEAVEDHRASASRAPRSIYGKIVAEADRDIDSDTVFRRTIQFGLSNYQELDKEGHWKRFQEHMQSKYSKDGYIKLWIPNSPNAQRLNALRNIIAQPEQLRKEFERLFDDETQP